MAALTVRLLPSEKARFDRMQRDSKKSVNTIVGELVEKCELHERPLAALMKVTDDVNAVGKEINAIARSMNSARRATDTEIDEVIKKEDELISRLKAIVSQIETLK